MPEHGPGFAQCLQRRGELHGQCTHSTVGRLLRARLDGLVANREKVGPADRQEDEMIYGVSPDRQDELITKHCFGDCGAIQCAGADGGEHIGGVFLCLQEFCPHEDRITPILGDIQGEPFKVRKLK